MFTLDIPLSREWRTRDTSKKYMKIDLYNNHDTFIKQQQQSYELRSWARRMGIPAREFEAKLDSHPFIVDIRVLIDLNMYKHLFNRKDQQVFNHIWHQVYQLEYPLSVYHRKKLLQVVKSVEYIQQKLKNEKSDHNDE